MVGYHFSSLLTATLNLCLIYFKITWEPSILLEHMHKKFEINRTKIKGGCQSGRKEVTHNFNSDLPLASLKIVSYKLIRHVTYVLTKQARERNKKKCSSLPSTTVRWNRKLNTQ